MQRTLNTLALRIQRRIKTSSYLRKLFYTYSGKDIDIIDPTVHQDIMLLRAFALYSLRQHDPHHDDTKTLPLWHRIQNYLRRIFK
jgi:hypothetical protein